MGGGEQWRPLVHVSDVAKAFITTLNLDSTVINREVFNIGLDNFQIKNLAYMVRDLLPFQIEIDIAPDDADKRNYNVEFNKAKDRLKFTGKISVEDGIKEIYSALKGGKVDVGTRTVTVSWYKNILDANNLINSIELNGRVI
jgi:nucleoside-diphosphate-sugar epimerase